MQTSGYNAAPQPAPFSSKVEPFNPNPNPPNPYDTNRSVPSQSQYNPPENQMIRQDTGMRGKPQLQVDTPMSQPRRNNFPSDPPDTQRTESYYVREENPVNTNPNPVNSNYNPNPNPVSSNYNPNPTNSSFNPNTNANPTNLNPNANPTSSSFNPNAQSLPSAYKPPVIETPKQGSNIVDPWANPSSLPQQSNFPYRTSEGQVKPPSDPWK